MPLDSVSVVIPIYGNFIIERALIVIDSIKMQEGVDVEIVVSEQGEKRRFPEVDGVKYVFTYHKAIPEFSDFNPGEIRNIAIAESTKDFIYTNDADIVFSNPLFLRKSIEFLKENPKRVLYRPFMRRLPLNNFDEFYRWYKDFGIKIALNKLIMNQDFLVKTSEEYRELKKFEKYSEEANYKKTFTSLIEDYNKYLAEGLGSDKELNFWPVYWNENRHCGSNLFRRSHFEEVGKYCENFINWGCEDSDLQWKFRETLDLEFFPSELEVIHLDHPKDYVFPKMWAENEKICSLRRLRGVEVAIKEDKSIIRRKKFGE